MNQCIRYLMFSRYGRDRLFATQGFHYDLVTLLLRPTTRFGHCVFSSGIRLTPRPGLWKLPRYGNRWKNLIWNGNILSDFSTGSHRAWKTRRVTEQAICTRKPRRVFHSSHSPCCYWYQVKFPLIVAQEFLLIQCSEFRGTRQTFPAAS